MYGSILEMSGVMMRVGLSLFRFTLENFSLIGIKCGVTRVEAGHVYSGLDSINSDFYATPYLPAITLEQKPYDPEGVFDNVWWNHAMDGIHYILHNDERRDEGEGMMSWDPYTQSIKGSDPYNDGSRILVGTGVSAI